METTFSFSADGSPSVFWPHLHLSRHCQSMDLWNGSGWHHLSGLDEKIEVQKVVEGGVMV